MLLFADPWEGQSSIWHPHSDWCTWKWTGNFLIPSLSQFCHFHRYIMLNPQFRVWCAWTHTGNFLLFKVYVNLNLLTWTSSFKCVLLLPCLYFYLFAFWFKKRILINCRQGYMLLMHFTCFKPEFDVSFRVLQSPTCLCCCTASEIECSIVYWWFINDPLFLPLSWVFVASTRNSSNGIDIVSKILVLDKSNNSNIPFNCYIHLCLVCKKISVE